MKDVLTVGMIKKAIRILQKNNDNPWEGQEGKWAILLTRDEIRVFVKCLKIGFFEFCLDKTTKVEDRNLVMKFIKSLGEIA